MRDGRGARGYRLELRDEVAVSGKWSGIERTGAEMGRGGQSTEEYRMGMWAGGKEYR